MGLQYLGWVPTVTGNLSFSIIGTGRNPKKLYKNYHSENGRKFTVAVQKRRTSDRIGLRTGRIKEYCFIYLAVSFLDEGHYLNHGVVFLVPSKEYWRYKYLIQGLSQHRFRSDTFSASFESTIKSLKTVWSKRHVVVVHTKLDRKGKLYIDLSDDEFWEDQEGTVANQVYYFIRDITHTHQHHEPSSDTILKAYPDEKLRRNGNTNWKRETLYALHKFIIQQKRGKRYESLVRCQGVLAYARAFSLLHVNREEDDVPQYLDEPLRNSLVASSAEARERTPKNLFDIVFGGVLPFLTFIVAYLAFSDFVPDNSANWQSVFLFSLLEWTKRNPIAFIFLPFFPYSIFILSKFLKRWIFPKIRPLQRVLLSFGYYESVFLIGSLFGIGLIASLCIFFRIFS